ncbi:MAG: YIP1 family protein [Tannerellaceae bacterium]|jgi:hypothetical protein|nr:YIP1 family protein [Tannerellaceae bacterium]
MYKELFRQVVYLILNPRQAWQDLAVKEEKNDESLTGFVYPLVGLVAAAAFVGIFFTETDFSVEVALKTSIKALFSSAGGFFLASWLLSEALKGVFRRETDQALCRRFVGYSSVAMFVIHILFSFLPFLPLSRFFFLRVFILFVPTMLITWEGAIPYMRMENEQRLKFTLIASLLIVMLPEIFGRLLFMVLPGLRI